MKYLLIYGSQTGQSEAIAEQIAVLSTEVGLEAELLCGEDVQMEMLSNQVVVIVVSSTGDGDPPENFESFWTALNERPPCNLTFALLGLGDSNYTRFGGFPGDFNDFLIKSGAKSFYEYQLADDQVGLELVVEPWIEGLWEPLKEAITCSQSLDKQTLRIDAALLTKLSQLEIEQDPQKTKIIFDLQFSENDFKQTFPYGVRNFIMPFSAGELEESQVLSRKSLTSQHDKVKETLELQLATNDSYGPGDSLGILCHNSDEEVSRLLDVLQLSGSAHKQYSLTPDPGVKPRLLPKHVMLECSPWYALKYTLDVHSLPKKALLKYLSQCCVKVEDARCLYFLASKEGSDDLNELIYSRSLTLLEILTLFPSCRPSFSGLLQFLPRLTPRYYSVSRIHHQTVEPDRMESGVDSLRNSEVSTDLSRPDSEKPEIKYPHSVNFVFNQITNIRDVSELPKIPGVCSTWLNSLKIGDPVFMYRRKNDSFKPSVNESEGIIMIGAGTGVAPYLGFLDHIKETSPSTPTLLITGNRYRELDSIYGDTFSEYSKNTLTSYRRAYSRDSDSECRYVQDILKRDALDIVSWIDTARVYVCGDAKGLGAAVFETLKKILCEVKQLSEQESQEVLADMKRDKRYCEDIWS